MSVSSKIRLTGPSGQTTAKPRPRPRRRRCTRTSSASPVESMNSTPARSTTTESDESVTASFRAAINRGEVAMSISPLHGEQLVAVRPDPLHGKR
jgi:hypothetical protein